MSLIGSMIIKSRLHDYQAIFCNSSKFIEELLTTPNCFFIVDSNVWNLYSDNLLSGIKSKNHFILNINEDRKTLAVVEEVYDEIIKMAPKKNMTIVSIGGGILQDITGFCASTLYRGVNWIYVPTTLLAQSDSCIGSKTSLNYKNYKNLIGTFYPPRIVYIYTEFLKTLNEVDFYSGIGEIAKLHLMGGATDTVNFKDFIPHIKDEKKNDMLKFIKRSLIIKKSFIEDDEFDSGKRNMLNFGHCFGHAIESATNFDIPHGQSVVLGILLANIVALNRKILSSDNEQFLKKSILFPILKMDFNKLKFDDETVINGMKKDKKRTGAGLALIMINNNYEMIKEDNISEFEALGSLKSFRTYMKELSK